MGRWIAIAVLLLLVLVLGINLGARSARLDDSRDELRKVLDAYAQLSVTLDYTEAAVDATEAELAQSEAKLVNTQSQLSDAEAELGNTRSQLSDTEAELAQSKAELGNTRSQLSDTEAELADLQESFSKLEAVKGITFNSKLELSDISAPWSTVSGKVKNVGDEPLKKVMIFAVFYAEDGSFTGGWGYDSVEALFVGETAEWSIYEWEEWTTFDVYAFTDK